MLSCNFINIGRSVVRQKERRFGIYLLPNLVTTASLFAAFYSLVSSLQGRYEEAAISIFVGWIADSLDGRIARLTNTQTPFGAQYDSLSDMVTFGVAPALLLFSWSLHFLGKFGWLVAFTYTAMVALRLARFNTQLETDDKRYFQGLASPAAAASIASYTGIFYDKASVPSSLVIAGSAALMILMAFSMVSNIRYNSFKQLNFKERIPFPYLLGVIAFFVAVAAEPFTVLFLGLMIYAVSGPLQTLRLVQRIRRARHAGMTRRKNRKS